MNLRAFNVEGVRKKLQALGVDSGHAMNTALSEAGMLIHKNAVESIHAHESKGLPYRLGGVTHIASLPGFPPNSDTGRLAQSIAFEVDQGKHSVLVGTNLNYGAWLEFGTLSVAPRPWLMPAARRAEPKLMTIFEKAMLSALKKAGA